LRPLFLTEARVIDPAGGRDGRFDLLVEDGRIRALEPPGSIATPEGAVVVDLGGCWVMPGLVDPHVHLRDPGDPGKETIASGLRAAAAGGFTTVAAMANTRPVNDNPEVAGYMLRRSAESHSARLVPVGALTLGLGGRELVDYEAMAEAGVRLFSDDGVAVDDPLILSRALRAVERTGLPVSLHEEDGAASVRGAVNAGEVARRLGVGGVPVSSETERLRRDLALALDCGARVHIAHVSAAESVELIRAARKARARVSSEVTPHHFTLEEGAVLRWGTNAKMSPPLRSGRDRQALIDAMADGTIDMIATDHAPHDPGAKRMDRLAHVFDPAGEAGPLSPDLADAFTSAANGVVGLETALGLALRLVHRGTISAGRLVEMMSQNPAQLLGIEGGTLSPGSVADITVAHPNLAWTVDPGKFLSRSRNTPFSGMQLLGKAVLTIVGGQIVYDGRRAEG